MERRKIEEREDQNARRQTQAAALVTAACIASARCGTVLELRPAMLIRLHNYKMQI